MCTLLARPGPTQWRDRCPWHHPRVPAAGRRAPAAGTVPAVPSCYARGYRPMDMKLTVTVAGSAVGLVGWGTKVTWPVPPHGTVSVVGMASGTK